ncbi:hypothetical protein ABIC65_000409 [Sphingomonas trueperi]|uniref:hypothetical protein n=1 Tax=Sphingomonas trueperi TaxID=53317 RepID=UPI00339225FD
MASKASFSRIIASTAVLLAGCTAGGKIDVTVVSPSDVRFVVPESGRKGFCLNALEIGRVGNGRRTTPVWKIAARPATDGLQCRYEVRFPQVPPEFEVTSKAARLAPGEYMVFVDGGLPQISTSFRVR